MFTQANQSMKVPLINLEVLFSKQQHLRVLKHFKLRCSVKPFRPTHTQHIYWNLLNQPVFISSTHHGYSPNYSFLEDSRINNISRWSARYQGVCWESTASVNGAYDGLWMSPSMTRPLFKLQLIFLPVVHTALLCFFTVNDNYITVLKWHILAVLFHLDFKNLLFL